MTNLEKYLYQLRRISDHREKTAEKEIRKTYKELLKELNAFLGNTYAAYSVDDVLDYSTLAKAGMDARFLEEVEQRINSVTPKVAKQIQETVEATYTACYDGMVDAVKKAGSNRELLQKAFESVSTVTPDVIKAAVNNPVSGLTLKDTLEKHRKEIIYDIKKNIGVGLSNGDRFSTMARRIAESLDGDYKKSVRIVRTEAHRVRESGFNDAATELNNTLKSGSSGYVMAKTWRTMADERVRPNKAKGKSKKNNHVKMDGVTIMQDELFKLPSGATCKAPSQTGVAGEDINCRCYLSYDLVLASELTKVQDGKKTIEEAAKVVEPQAYDFTPAKTVEEAEEYAKRFVVKKTWSGNGNVSYKGLSIETANEFNKTLTELYETCEMPELSNIQPMNFRANIWKGSEKTPMAYRNLSNGELYFNPKILKSEKALKEYIEEGKKAYDICKNNINRFTGKDRETIETYIKAGRSLVSEDAASPLAAMLQHEMGHHIQNQIIYRDKAGAEMVANGFEKYCIKISGYATTSLGEYIAESFCAYKNKQAGLIDPDLKAYFERLEKK